MNVVNKYTEEFQHKHVRSAEWSLCVWRRGIAFVRIYSVGGGDGRAGVSGTGGTVSARSENDARGAAETRPQRLVTSSRAGRT